MGLHRLSSSGYTLLCFERYNLLNNERFSVRFSFGTALTDKSLDSKARQTKNQNELNKIGGLTACIIETTPLALFVIISKPQRYRVKEIGFSLLY